MREIATGILPGGAGTLQPRGENRDVVGTRTVRLARTPERAWKWDQPTTPSQYAKKLMQRDPNALGDVEGSHPALSKFRKANQRIMADPYPGQPSAPRTIDHHKFKRSPLYFTETDVLHDQHPHLRQSLRQHPYLQPKTDDWTTTPSKMTPGKQHQIVVKRQEVYVDGHYKSVVSTNNATKRSFAAHLDPNTQGCLQGKMSSESGAVGAPRVHTPRARRSVSPSTVCFHNTDDIDGATPRTYYERLAARRVRAQSPTGQPTTPGKLFAGGKKRLAMPAGERAQENARPHQQGSVTPVRNRTPIKSSHVSPGRNGGGAGLEFFGRRSSLDVSDIPGASPRRTTGGAVSPARTAPCANPSTWAKTAVHPSWW